jgi:hypothetical protein
MADVVYSVAVGLDGFVSGPRPRLAGPGAWRLVTTTRERSSTRWERLSSAAAPMPTEQTMRWFATGPCSSKPVYVFTSRDVGVAGSNITLTDASPQRFIAELDERHVTQAGLLRGPTLLASFRAASLVTGTSTSSPSCSEVDSHSQAHRTHRGRHPYVANRGVQRSPARARRQNVPLHAFVVVSEHRTTRFRADQIAGPGHDPSEAARGTWLWDCDGKVMCQPVADVAVAATDWPHAEADPQVMPPLARIAMPCTCCREPLPRREVDASVSTEPNNFRAGMSRVTMLGVSIVKRGGVIA